MDNDAPRSEPPRVIVVRQLLTDRCNPRRRASTREVVPDMQRVSRRRHFAADAGIRHESSNDMASFFQIPVNAKELRCQHARCVAGSFGIAVGI